ncbi:Hypothetical protein NTJ_06328 [Nesidiocoris tenuis]|uniref:Uncharacterized protein n=1 Tax=Nesidiocoris tenuis TaxID=355587 RepID=A0ABN7AMQ3_9HEMI|nr:Hypothetical protein NTJ_06328 [Nesidiocoris tenuis]
MFVKAAPSDQPEIYPAFSSAAVIPCTTPSTPNRSRGWGSVNKNPLPFLKSDCLHWAKHDSTDGDMLISKETLKSESPNFGTIFRTQLTLPLYPPAPSL